MELQFFKLVALFTFLLFIFAITKLTKKNKSLNLPPGPRRLPIIGNMHQLVGDLPHYKLRDLAKIYGPIMHLKLGEVTTIVVSSPEVAKEIMKTQDIHFCQRPQILALHIATYKGLDIILAPYSEYWRLLRKLSAMQLFCPQRVQALRPIREEEATNLISFISASQDTCVDISSLLFSTFCSLAAKEAFGRKYKDQDIFLKAQIKLLKMASGFNVADVFPSSKWLHFVSGVRSKLEKAHQELDAIYESIVNEHIARHSMANRNSNEGEDDLIDVLLNLQKQGNLGFTLTTANIKAIVFDLFAGGTETSTTTLVWAMSELIKNPSVLEKAQKEVRQVFDKKGKVNEANIDGLKYLDLVIKETLRLHPPIPFILPRECIEHRQVNGYDIPTKARVMVNVWAMQRDPSHWSEAEVFIPERFLNSPLDYGGTHFEYLPFGAGRRICPGILFGTTNVRVILANLLYHFDWKLPNKSKNEDLDMTEQFGLIMQRKNPLVLVPARYHPMV